MMACTLVRRVWFSNATSEIYPVMTIEKLLQIVWLDRRVSGSEEQDETLFASVRVRPADDRFEIRTI